jgi:hypothetical protein
MPDRFELQVQLDDGEWLTEAVAAAADFYRLQDGSYICSSGASGLWIRCIECHEDYFIHVDGGGDRFRYRLLDVSDTS